MPCLLMLLWVGSVIGLWLCAIRGLRETASEVSPGQRDVAWAAIFIAAVAPTLVFVVSAIVLLQAAPTVQFNVGSSLAMSLWSFWVQWWLAIFGCSGLQTVCYLLWLTGTLVTRTRSSVRYVVGFGFLSSVWGSLLLSMAWPDA